MTRIHITDETITIKRSDLPAIGKVQEYEGHDPQNGTIAVCVDDSREFFLGASIQNNYQHWLPEQEQYILDDLAALIWAQGVDAELNVSEAEKLRDDIREIDGNNTLGAAALAEILVKRGWGKK